MGIAEIFASLNWALIAVIIAGLLGGMGFMKAYKSKKARKMGNMFAIVLVGVALVGAFVPQASVLTNPIDLANIFSAGVDDTDSGYDSGTICAVEDTTITLSSINAETSAATGGTHRYKIGNSPALTVSDAGTFTASPGDTISILWGNATDDTYYGAVTEAQVPCVGTKTFSTERYQNGTVTIEVFNEEGNLIDTAGENETMAAGDVVTLSAKIKGTFQRGLPYGGVMVVEFNGTGTSEIDDVIVNFGGQETTVPGIYAITLGTSARTKAYTIPPIIGNAILEGSIVIDADDSNNPADADDPVLTFYANDYYIDEDNGGSYSGPAVADEDNAQTFAHTTAFTLNVD